MLPIEVKSGKTYSRHAALNHVLANPAYRIPEAWVFCNENVSQQGDITYYPIYMVSFLQRENLDEDLIYKPDLRILT